MNQFFTIKYPAEGIYKEKGSKFLAFAYPVQSEEEVRARLDELRKQFHDARHHCYAYIVGLKEQSYRGNDDGEPAHSAGDPILGQIRSKNLTNCLVVVVRYFGGIKLGVGGLVSAYKIAAEAALNEADVVTIYSKTRFTLTFEYPATSDVERILNEFEIDYLEKIYTSKCHFVGLIKDEEFEVVKGKLELCEGVLFEAQT